MPTDLTALHDRLLTRLDGASKSVVTTHNDVIELGAILSGLAAAIAAVRVELDREREATACRMLVDEPCLAEEWAPPPVETVWGRAEWEDGTYLCVEGEHSGAHIAYITPTGWITYGGRIGDKAGSRGDASSILDAHEQAIAALRAAGSLA